MWPLINGWHGVYFAKTKNLVYYHLTPSTTDITEQIHKYEAFFFFFKFKQQLLCFHTPPPWPPLSLPLPLPPNREKHYRCNILFGVKTGTLKSSSCSQSYCERGFSCLNINLSFLFFFKLQPGFTSTIVHCSRQDPSSHFQTTEEMWHLEEGGKLRPSTV